MISQKPAASVGGNNLFQFTGLLACAPCMTYIRIQSGSLQKRPGTLRCVSLQAMRPGSLCAEGLQLKQNLAAARII